MTKMTIDRAAVEQALKALAGYRRHIGDTQPCDAETSLLDALAQQAGPETCTWQQDGDSHSGVYATSCGHCFNLEDGTPEDNKMAHCCYCGKKLVQELIVEDDDE